MQTPTGEAGGNVRQRAGLVPVAVAVLILIGVVASAARSMYPDSLASHMEPVRSALLAAVGTADPLADQRATTMERFDRRFGDHVELTYIHVVLGSIFLLLAPFQFSERLRNRRRRLHRWTGRLLVAIGLVAAAAGLFFGLVVPIAGTAERIVVAVFGATVMAALVAGFAAIRRGDMTRHRAWMVRAFAVMLGISTVRVVGLVLDLALTPLGYPVETIFVLSLWTGWVGTLAAAEAWLHHTAGDGRVHLRLFG